jgi:hypothetical protein
MAFAAFGVFVPGDFFAGETVIDDVGPAVSVEIVGVGEETIRVRILDAEGAFIAGNGFFAAIGFLSLEGRIGRAKLVTFFEIGSLVPERPGLNIHDAVMIEVADIGTLRPELIGGLDLFESVREIFPAGNA